MSMWNEPHLKRGWLDGYGIGDEVYFHRQVGSFGIPKLDLHKGLIKRATKTQIVVTVYLRDEKGKWRESTMEKVFRRGEGRSEWSPYRYEGQEPGDLSGRYRCYPITTEWTTYFESALAENNAERLAVTLANKLTDVRRDSWVEYGVEKMQAILDELKKIEEGS